MTYESHDFALGSPGTLIAAVPAVLGFRPSNSLVLVTFQRGEMGLVSRMDLPDALAADLGPLARTVSASSPDAAVAVIVDADGFGCADCHEDYHRLAEDLELALNEYGIALLAAHVVDRVLDGGRWRCADDCGQQGRVDDPSVSPMAVAAVVDGRRLYASRADLQKVIAADPAADALADRISEAEAEARPGRDVDPVGSARRGIETAIQAVEAVGSGTWLADTDVVDIGHHLTDSDVRDTLYALAVGRDAGRAEALWTLLSRRLPSPWRLEALVLLAFSAYVRGDGPLAGIALQEALRCNSEHRMAKMLDTALQSGMRPEQIRELALTGYQVADRLGVQLPPRRRLRRRAS